MFSDLNGFDQDVFNKDDYGVHGFDRDGFNTECLNRN